MITWTTTIFLKQPKLIGKLCRISSLNHWPFKWYPYFLDHYPTIKLFFSCSRTPLHLCAGNMQSLEVSFVLVEHGARIEDNDIEGKRPVDLQHVSALIMVTINQCFGKYSETRVH